MNEQQNKKEELAQSPLAEQTPERSGEYLWRVLKPAGCIFVLLIFVLYLVFCFTYRSDPADAPAPTAVTETQQP